MNSTSNSAESVKPVIPVLVGPTAIGKTAIALELTDHFNLEIISCDSRQIYKFLNIGTAKPTAAELGSKPYRLIDYVQPDKSYSSTLYRADAVIEIERILAAKKTPLIVGGTGLYLKAVTSGFFATPDPDESYRHELESLATPELYKRLRSIDPTAAETIAENNRIRVIRALEIHKLTGRSKTELSTRGNYPEKKYDFAIFELNRSREKLYQFINLRVDKMIREGLIAEVENLVEMGFGQSPVLKQTVGYREALDLLNNRLNRSQCVELIKQKTRNYAKRQVTWFRPDPNIVRINLDDESGKEKLLVELDKLKLDT
ncbi:MAG: tRNA (adenosine(37)-N6)-dimethylallyltransferase MiaA [Candidatus Zixiibacteriota bacterium]